MHDRCDDCGALYSTGCRPDCPRLPPKPEWVRQWEDDAMARTMKAADGLPELPPGWRWRALDDLRVAHPPWAHVDAPLTAHGLVVPPGADPQPHAGRAWSLHRATLRAAITAAATEAGVVLPEGYDVGAVLRDGVQAHGWWWSASPTGIRFLHSPDGAFVLYPGGDWMGPGPRPRYGTVSADTPEADAQALWDAVGPEGLPMPPLPPSVTD